VAYVCAALAGAEHLGTVVLRGRERPLGTSGRRTLERGAVVTALVLLFTRSVADAEDRVRGELLTELLSSRGVDRMQLRERARRHHADLDRLGVVLVAAVAEGERHRCVQVASRLAREHGGLGGLHEGHVVVVVPGEDPLRLGGTLAERLAGGGAPVTVGVGRADDGGAEALRAAWEEARTCLSTLLTLGRAGEVSDATGLGLARLVLGRHGPAELEAFLRRTLGALAEYDERRGTDLLLTLETWFAGGSSLAEAARRLHVHPNTVTQRLDRIGTLLGPGWRDPEQALEQQLALRLWRLRDVAPLR
jgi:sugar diacid utilization regulator